MRLAPWRRFPPPRSSAPALRHRRGQGAPRARHPVHLLRGLRPRRRQLGLRQQERDVGRLPPAVHQHLARPDGVLGLPDAEVLSGLPAPRADRGLLRRLRRALRLPRPHPLRDQGAARRADAGRRLGADARRRLGRALRRAARGQRPPLGSALARADVPRPRQLHGRADPRPLLRRQRHLRRQGRGHPRDGQLGDGHRGGVLLRGAHHLPGRPPRRVDHPQVHVRPPRRPAAAGPARSRSRSASA